jgi:hypothetical protein
MSHWISLNTVTKARLLDVDEPHRCSAFMSRVASYRWMCSDHAWRDHPRVAAVVLGYEEETAS